MSMEGWFDQYMYHSGWFDQYMYGWFDQYMYDVSQWNWTEDINGRWDLTSNIKTCQ